MTLLACLLAASVHAQYTLKRIEIERTYWKAAASRGSGAIEPGKSVAKDRAFRFGWSYAWGSGNHNRCDATLKLDKVPDTLTPGQQAAFELSLAAEWDTKGFTVAREHYLDLSGSLGSTADRPDCPPNGTCRASLQKTTTYSVPASGEIAIEMKASVSFGEDGGSIDVRLIYEAVIPSVSEETGGAGGAESEDSCASRTTGSLAPARDDSAD